MPPITVTAHFNKNGRMINYGRRETSNGLRYLSRTKHALGWMGYREPNKPMMSIIADGHVIGYVLSDEVDRKFTLTVPKVNEPRQWDIDVNMRLLIRQKLDTVFAEKYMPGDWVLVDGKHATVQREHVRKQIDEETWGNFITVIFHGETTEKEVPLKTLKFV